MAFTAEYEDETATSATFNPTESVSEYVIEGTFTGIVRLQMSIPDLDSFLDKSYPRCPWPHREFHQPADQGEWRHRSHLPPRGFQGGP